MWREDIRDDVHATLDGGSVMRFLEGWSAQFLEWRRTDDRVVAQLQSHISDLAEQNRSLRLFLQQYVSTEEFTLFRKAMADYSRLVDELVGTSEGRESRLIKAIERSVERLVSDSIGSLSAEFGSREEVWHRLGEEQHNRWAADLNARFDQLQDFTRSLEKEVASQDLNVRDRFEAILGEVTDRVEATMRWTTRDIGDSTLKAVRELAVSTRSSMNEAFEGIRRHVTRLISGDAADVKDVVEEGDKHVHGLMKRFDERLCQGVASHEQAERWREEAERWRATNSETCGSLQDARNEISALSKKMQNLDASLHEREAELGRVQAKLLEPITWKKLIVPLERAQKRDRLKLDLQDGDVEILAGMEFMPRKANEGPSAEFRDPETAEAAIADAVEVLAVFPGVQAVVESHSKQVKGPATFLERIVQNRAELVKGMLEKKGVPEGQLSTAGFPGNKGLNRNCVRIRLAVFPPKEAEPPQKGGKRSARSPSPRG